MNCFMNQNYIYIYTTCYQLILAPGEKKHRYNNLSTYYTSKNMFKEQKEGVNVPGRDITGELGWTIVRCSVNELCV